MYVSPQAIVYQASEHEPLLQRWHEGTKQLDLRGISEQLNFIELMFIHAGHARVLASPNAHYLEEVLPDYATHWASYIHNTGSYRYRDKPDHEAFAKKREENPWLLAQDQLSIEELLLANPFGYKSFNQRVKLDIYALQEVQNQALKQAEIYVPGVGKIQPPINYKYKPIRSKKKKNWKKMYFHAHNISKHYKGYPRFDYQHYIKKKIQYNNEKAWLYSKNKKNPSGIQTELKLQTIINQPTYYKTKPPSASQELPRGADFEQYSFADELCPVER